VAKKSKTPAPPRPVQAPKVRHDPRMSGASRTRLWIAAGAAVFLIVAIGGGMALAKGRGGGSASSAPASNDVCKIQTFPAQGQKHVLKLEKGFEYNSYPPTSGPHYPEPLVFGEYAEPLLQIRLLHDLEHGGIGVQYGPDVPAATLRELVAWYRTDPRGLILAPLPDDPRAAKYNDSIVLTVWVADRVDPTDPQSKVTKQTGILADCATFDRGTFDSFVQTNRAHGPELYTLDQLAPGF
jgi:hypothetical protein